MIRAFVLTEVASEIGALLPPGADCRFGRVSTDTRNLQPGDLFVALRGEHFDAHDFLQTAAEKGACGLVVERVDKRIPLPQLQVRNSVLALGQIARLNRQLFNGLVVAITGSSGKTTVKGMCAEILAHCGKVHATRGNLNNHIGVPLTLLDLAAEHKYAVIEMGASAGGEIAYLVGLATPDVALVNNVMPAHVEGFGSIEGVARAKAEIYSGLKAQGTAVVNLDDRFAADFLARCEARPQLTFSVQNPKADFYAIGIGEAENGCPRFTLSGPFGNIEVTLGIIGRQNIANALAAAACCYAVGADPAAVAAGLQGFRPVTGRMELRRGQKGALIIDDSYNANPGSVRAAIDTLASRSEEKVLVLGDLAELGQQSAVLHRELGVYARQRGIDRLLTVGELSENAAIAYGPGAEHFSEREAAIDKLQEIMDAHMVLLIKGSRSARMELVVRAISESGEQ